MRGRPVKFLNYWHGVGREHRGTRQDRPHAAPPECVLTLHHESVLQFGVEHRAARVGNLRFKASVRFIERRDEGKGRALRHEATDPRWKVGCVERSRPKRGSTNQTVFRDRAAESDGAVVQLGQDTTGSPWSTRRHRAKKRASSTVLAHILSAASTAPRRQNFGSSTSHLDPFVSDRSTGDRAELRTANHDMVGTAEPAPAPCAGECQIKVELRGSLIAERAQRAPQRLDRPRRPLPTFVTRRGWMNELVLSLTFSLDSSGHVICGECRATSWRLSTHSSQAAFLE